jgi:hypothetical protein
LSPELLLLGRTAAHRADIGSWEHYDLLELTGIELTSTFI